MDYAKRIDTAGQYTYIGLAIPGSADDAPAWKIKRMEDLGNDDFSTTWADGNSNAVHKWSDHLTYSYT